MIAQESGGWHRHPAAWWCLVPPHSRAALCTRCRDRFWFREWFWVQHGARYPLVNIQKTIESGHRNSWFTHKKWWFSIVMLVYQRVSPFIIYAPGPATPPPPPPHMGWVPYTGPIWDLPPPPPVVWWGCGTVPLPPLWCGGGVVWYGGYVWCVWSVWYGMFGKYGMFGMYGRYGMYGMSGWYCMYAIVCMLLYVW